jgi:hypothetical protein
VQARPGGDSQTRPDSVPLAGLPQKLAQDWSLGWCAARDEPECSGVQAAACCPASRSHSSIQPQHTACGSACRNPSRQRGSVAARCRAVAAQQLCINWRPFASEACHAARCPLQAVHCSLGTWMHCQPAPSSLATPRRPAPCNFEPCEDGTVTVCAARLKEASGGGEPLSGGGGSSRGAMGQGAEPGGARHPCYRSCWNALCGRAGCPARSWGRAASISPAGEAGWPLACTSCAGPLSSKRSAANSLAVIREWTGPRQHVAAEPSRYFCATRIQCTLAIFLTSQVCNCPCLPASRRKAYLLPPRPTLPAQPDTPGLGRGHIIVPWIC